MAPRKFQRLLTGTKPHDLRLLTGVTVTGRIIKDAKPVAGVAVGLTQKNRGGQTFLGPFQAGTDENGVFRIPNVPAEDNFVVYGQMNSFRALGAVGVKEIRTGASRSEATVGDLAVRPGHRLAGWVELSDVKPLPAGTRILLSREEAWDVQTAEVDEKGAFAFEGLPSERYSLSANVPGYHVSPKNASYDLLNTFQLLGVVPSDVERFRLLFEPGPPADRQGPLDRNEREEYTRRRSAPLTGAPQTNDGK
jgi:hypothetical protein